MRIEKGLPLLAKQDADQRARVQAADLSLPLSFHSGSPRRLIEMPPRCLSETDDLRERSERNDHPEGDTARSGRSSAGPEVCDLVERWLDCCEGCVRARLWFEGVEMEGGWW